MLLFTHWAEWEQKKNTVAQVWIEVAICDGLSHNYPFLGRPAH